MATNAWKTEMVNLAILKLGGATNLATTTVDDIDDTVFAAPSTATDETTRLACISYPHALKKALKDIKPKFARRYADLGAEIKITQNGASGIIFETADYPLIFELPADYVILISQLDETLRTEKKDAVEIMVHSYAHVVKGTDGQAYYCKAAVTGAAANKPITGASYATYFALFNADDDYGADWESGHAYKSAQSGRLLLSKDYSNEDGDSAYIEYLAYTATGIGDMPQYYDEDFVEAFTTLLAYYMAPYVVDKDARMALRVEYERLSKKQAQAADSEPDYDEEPETWLEARTT